MSEPSIEVDDELETLVRKARTLGWPTSEHLIEQLMLRMSEWRAQAFALQKALERALDLADCKPLPHDGEHIKSRWRVSIAQLRKLVRS